MTWLAVGSWQLAVTVRETRESHESIRLSYRRTLDEKRLRDLISFFSSVFFSIPNFRSTDMRHTTSPSIDLVSFLSSSSNETIRI